MYKKRRYELINLDNGRKLVLDETDTNNHPRNGEDSEPNYKRSVKNYSETRLYSKNLEFTGSGAAFLRDAYNSKDVEAKVKYYEYKFNPDTDEPYVYIIADFDFTGYNAEKTIVKVPLNQGGLTSIIDSKKSDKFELNRTESINGFDIGDLQIDRFAAVNRPLFLDSKSKTNPLDSDTNLYVLNVFEPYLVVGFPSEVVYDSDDRFVSILPNITDETPANGLSSMMFYYLNNIEKTFKLTINSSFRINAEAIGLTDLLALDLVIYNNGDNLDVKQRIRLKEYNNIDNQSIDEFVNVNYNNDNFTLLPDESLSLQWICLSPNPVSIFTFRFYQVDNEIRIQENSIRTDLPRQFNCVRNETVGKRLLSIVNDDPETYYSDFFNSSEFKNTSLASGEWIRGFSDRNITTSIKDFLENTKSLFNTGYNIEFFNGKETLVHEPLKYFFRNEVCIKIDSQVNNVVRTVASDFIFNTVNSGYKKPSGDNLYEEVNGLNEYNTSNQYVTPITRLTNEYDIESPYRADSEGKELTVRKSIQEFPTEDYRTDKTIFNLDLKDIGTGVFEERVWQDDYEEEPKNIFSPDTATGLRLTPYRNLERHFWFLTNAFSKFTGKFIRYSSTRGNSELITKKTRETEKPENGNYKIKDLEPPRFVSQWIEFEYKVDFELNEKVNGFTTVNNRRIPNTYFKVEFINEFNEKEYGYLFELKPNKEGKWKLLKAV